NILGQFSNAGAAASDGGADDLKNRDIFEERVAMVLRCWEEDSIVLDGNYYQAPFPLGTGVEKYPAARIAREAGADDEIDDAGSVRRVSVVPPTYRNAVPRSSSPPRGATTRYAIAGATGSSRPTSRSSTRSANRRR